MTTSFGTSCPVKLAMLAPLAVVITALSVSCASSGPPSATVPPSATGTSTAEVNPAGDIPDNQAYVPYSPPDGLFTISVPEGWARTSSSSTTTFDGKLNSVRIETLPRSDPPTVASAQDQEVPALASSVPGSTPAIVALATRRVGQAVLITYLAPSTPDGVTGRPTTDSVERYEFWRSGQQVNVTVAGPVGADNVDPWRMVTDSLQWNR